MVDIDKLRRAVADVHRLNGGQPTDLDLANAPVLDDWQVVAPCLAGVVTGHPKIPDGLDCVTSVVLAIDSNGQWARTVSRFYRLGKPHAAADILGGHHG